MEPDSTLPTLESLLRFRESLLSERAQLDRRVSAAEKAIEQFQIASAPSSNAGTVMLDLPCVKPGEFQGMLVKQALPRYGWARSDKVIPFNKIVSDLELGGVIPRLQRPTSKTTPRDGIAHNVKIALWNYEKNGIVEKEPKGKLLHVDEEKIVVRFLPQA